ncbi:hypothetical protein AMJ80_03560 [bacterium SM23_31]|nr:MAG: hypothetical protein AMJ80_03560 [bacterium SM23_31]
MKGMEKVKYFNPLDLKRIASEHITKFNQRVITKGEDARGRKFKKYSKQYAKLKANRFKTKSGKSYKGVPTVASQLSHPDFVLRGLTMKNLRFREAGKDYYIIGWDGEAAAIVEGNQSRGRDIASTIPDEEFNWILNRLGKTIEKEWKKIKNVTTVEVGSGKGLKARQ